MHVGCRRLLVVVSLSLSLSLSLSRSRSNVIVRTCRSPHTLSLTITLPCSYVAHTLYIASLFLIATWNGAKYYRYSFGRKMAASIVRELAALKTLDAVKSKTT